MGRFIALRELTASGGRKLQPGDAVPDAEKWPYHIQVSEVRVGHVYDLHREITLKEEGRSANVREEGLLARLSDHGKRVVPSETHPGRMEVQALASPEDEKLKLEAQTEPLTAYDADAVAVAIETKIKKRGRGRG